MRKVLLLGSLAVAVAASAWTVQSYNLRRIAKSGDLTKFDLKVEVEFNGDNILYTARIEEKVLEVKPDGSLKTESSQKDAKLIFAGQEMAPPEMGSTTATYDAAGNVVDLTGEAVDDSAYRFAQVTSHRWPGKPVGKGDKWEVKTAGNAKVGLIATVSSYEVEDFEKVNGTDTMRVKFSIKETEGSDPASSAGTVWFDPATGQTVKVSADMKNVPLAGQVLNAKYTLTLAK